MKAEQSTFRTALPGPIAAAFARQAQACAALGSQFNSALLTLVAERGLPVGAVADRIAGWQGDPTGAGDSVPLRLAGALHRLVLEGASTELAAAWPPVAQSFDARTVEAAMHAALSQCEKALLTTLESPPQTNEVRRSAILMAGLLAVRARTALPMALIEIGASAGLNLVPDRHAIRLGGVSAGDGTSGIALAPDWTGPRPPVGAIAVTSRCGCDINPLDPADPQDALSLAAYTWPDQRDRMQRLEQAIRAAQADRIHVERADAGVWLPAQLSRPSAGRCRVVFHTIAVQYMPAETKQAIAGTLAEAGTVATHDNPLAHLAFETDGKEHGAPLTLTFWPGGETVMLGRADFHGRWIEWAG